MRSTRSFEIGLSQFGQVSELQRQKKLGHNPAAAVARRAVASQVPWFCVVLPVQRLFPEHYRRILNGHHAERFLLSLPFFFRANTLAKEIRQLKCL